MIHTPAGDLPFGLSRQQVPPISAVLFPDSFLKQRPQPRIYTFEIMA